MQVLELIILAALAGVFLFQLYAVLGRRVGRGSDATPLAAVSGGGLEAQRPLTPVTDEAAAQGGVAAVRARDPAFEVGHFLEGSRGAYELIVKAFIAGDRAALQPLLAANVMENFETAMAQREAEHVAETIEFVHPPRADFEGVNLVGDLAKASVRFLAELRSRTTGPQGEAVADRRTAEIWTFERNLKNRNPNWTLIHVDPAES